MYPPFSTGQVAAILNVTEPLASEAVRRGKISPPPRVIAGRRLWEPDQVRQLAEHLGVATEELIEQLKEGESNA